MLLTAAAANAVDSEESVGVWSSEHQQLRARFIVRHASTFLDGKPGGPYSELLVYLELQNTSPGLGSMQLKLDIDPTTNIVYRVADERGSLIEPEPFAFRSTVGPGVYNLVLPPDGNLRFPVSISGGGVFEDKVKLDLSPSQGIWYFKKSDGGEYKLSGTLRVPALRERIGPLWWRGELEIPPVKLRFPGPNTQNAATTKAAEPRRGTER